MEWEGWKKKKKGWRSKFRIRGGGRKQNRIEQLQKVLKFAVRLTKVRTNRTNQLSYPAVGRLKKKR